MNTIGRPSGSDQLPIVVNTSQMDALLTVISDAYNLRDAEEMEISQSQGPVALHAIFVKSFYVSGNDTVAIDVNGDVSTVQKNVNEPTDDEIYNGPGREGGIAYSQQDSRDEHDPTL